ncbi:MAG TPA: PepSY-like domain-containing protein [Chitinophagaceae bacterium]|nr:PepSY-like domain-containing protein [Chitinophagaceae bacterium]
MKSKFLVLAAALSFGIMACNDNASTADEATKDSGAANTSSTESTPVDNNPVDVPPATKTSFEAKYPGASNVRWSHYEPAADRSTLDPADWNYKLDTSDYEVMFNWNGDDYYAWYDDGDWIRATTTMKDHSKLPAAVNDAIKAQYAGYEITEVDKENDKDRTTYEVDLKKGDDKLKVHFDENGKVVKEKGKVNGEKIKAKEEDKH